MKFRLIISSLLGYLIPIGLAIIMRLNQGMEMNVEKMLLYPVIFGGALIIVVLLLNKFVCRETVGSFNLKTGKITSDIRDGFLILFVYLIITIIFQFTLNRWINSEPPSREIMNLMQELSGNPILMIIWLGPVVWIGVGLFEELSRAFFLKNLWKLWPGPVIRWIVLIFTSILFGFVHLYQGPSGIISTAILAFIGGIYYLKIGRFWPLVIAHSLYDTAWIIFGVTMMNTQ